MGQGKFFKPNNVFNFDNVVGWFEELHIMLQVCHCGWSCQNVMQPYFWHWLHLRPFTSLITSEMLHLIISYCTLIDKMWWPIVTENENMELTYGLDIDFHYGWKEIMRFSCELFPFYLWCTSCEVMIVLVSTFMHMGYIFGWVIMHSFQSNYSRRRRVEDVLKCEIWTVVDCGRHHMLKSPNFQKSAWKVDKANSTLPSLVQYYYGLCFWSKCELYDI